jgi:hypothetical protein
LCLNDEPGPPFEVPSATLASARERGRGVPALVPAICCPLLHLGLIPVPYMGDLDHSSIFILMANPGLKNIDYYAEQENEELKKTLKNNLIQEDLDKEFPFACLNPKFSWYSGYE